MAWTKAVFLAIVLVSIILAVYLLYSLGLDLLELRDTRLAGGLLLYGLVSAIVITFLLAFEVNIMVSRFIKKIRDSL